MVFKLGSYLIKSMITCQIDSLCQALNDDCLLQRHYLGRLLRHLARLHPNSGSLYLSDLLRKVDCPYCCCYCIVLQAFFPHDEVLYSLMRTMKDLVNELYQEFAWSRCSLEVKSIQNQVSTEAF